VSGQHTTGPWRLEDRTYGWAVRGPYIGSLATVHDLAAQADGPPSDGDGTAEEMAANARLIAAAPDLLEALEGFVAQRERDHLPGTVGWSVFVEEDRLMVAARASIAKARGQS
jgi:hypothetical protein